MEYELLERLKDSAKSRVDLVFDTENRRVMVQKRLRGELPVYKRLLELPHPYLPKLYDVRIEDGETNGYVGCLTFCLSKLNDSAAPWPRPRIPSRRFPVKFPASQRRVPQTTTITLTIMRPAPSSIRPATALVGLLGINCYTEW